MLECLNYLMLNPKINKLFFTFNKAKNDSVCCSEANGNSVSSLSVFT